VPNELSESSELPVESLRRLARGVLLERGYRDATRAEDVVQEAWLAALQREGGIQGLAGWLAGAVRRLARNTLREEGRRGERERRAARPEAQASTAEASARIEILRALLDALDALEQPYRTAVVLRYFDDLPPRAIARRLGLPVNTVRTHVRRGLERLRRELDPGDEGERRVFLAALAPCAGKPWGSVLGELAQNVPAGKEIALLVMKKKLVLAGITLVLLGIAWRAWRGQDDGSPRPDEVASAVAAPADPVRAEEPAPEPATALADPPPAGREPLMDAQPLTGTWVVRGHVTRGTHAAFPGAPLVGRVFENLVSEEEHVLEQRFTADEAGDFAWPLEPPATMVKVSVQVDLSDQLGQGHWGYFLPGDAAPERWKVSSYPLDCLVRGRVLDPEGRPLAGARIVHGYWEEDAHSGPDGTFALRGPANYPSGRIRVIASGYAQTSLELGELPPGERSLPDIVLAPELRVRGRVLDQDGNPLAGARVSADYPHDRLPAVTSDAGGAFELGGLDHGSEHIAFSAFLEGYLRGHARLDQAGAEPELVLARGVRVRGRVLTPERAPVAGAYVHAGLFAWNEPEKEEWTWSDAEGAFELALLAPGTQHLWVQRTGFAHERHEIAVPASEPVLEGVELVIQPGHTLGGVVLDASGQPLSWAMIYANEAGYHHPENFAGVQTHAGADGRFRIDDLPARELTVGALAAGHARFETRVVELDRDDLVLRPEQRAAIAGRVLDESGAPVTSFLVRPSGSRLASEGEQPGGWPASWSQSGVLFDSPDGSWRLADDFAADKLFRVEIEAEGFAPALLDPVRTALEPDPDANVVRLARGTLVRGRVVERTSGAPVADARVRALRDALELRGSERTPPETVTDAGGRFEFLDLPVGPITLAVEHTGHALVLDGPFEVSAYPVERSIELGSGAGLRGRLLDASGRGRAGETVSVYGLEGSEKHRQHETTTGADGSYELRGLSAGTYHLRWQRRQGEVQVNDLLQMVTLGVDEVREVDLRPAGRATVRGTIRFEGELPELLSVMLLPETRLPPDWDRTKQHWAQRGRAAFAEDGVFELEHLEAGRWSAVVSFNLPDGTRALGGSGFFDVPEEGAVEVVVEVKER
jgi:RNA polymerase sigma-70 factor (ECF subfamily)